MSTHGPIVVVKVSDQQLWRRNQRFKNWGRYSPYLFRAGQPLLVVSGVKQIGVLVAIHLLSILRIISKDGGNPAKIVLPLLLLLIIYKLFRIQKDPGIKSSGLPVANIQQMLHDPQYCQSCLIIQNENVNHCLKCQVCIEDTYGHSWLLGRCITRQSYSQFLVLSGLIIAASALNTTVLLT